MKNYIQNNYPEKMSYINLRKAVNEAWEAVPEEFLDGLIDGMGERCWAVIEAEGRYTQF